MNAAHIIICGVHDCMILPINIIFLWKFHHTYDNNYLPLFQSIRINNRFFRRESRDHKRAVTEAIVYQLRFRKTVEHWTLNTFPTKWAKRQTNNGALMTMKNENDDDGTIIECTTKWYTHLFRCHFIVQKCRMKLRCIKLGSMFEIDYPLCLSSILAPFHSRS